MLTKHRVRIYSTITGLITVVYWKGKVTTPSGLFPYESNNHENWNQTA